MMDRGRDSGVRVAARSMSSSANQQRASTSGAGAANRLLRATKAQLLHGTPQQYGANSSFSPRQRELLAVASGDTSGNASGGGGSGGRHRRKKGLLTGPTPPGAPHAPRASFPLGSRDKLALSTNGELIVAELPAIQELPRSVMSDPSSDRAKGGQPTRDRAMTPEPQPAAPKRTAEKLRSESMPSPRKRKVKTQTSNRLHRSATLDSKLQGCKSSH